LSVIAVYTTVYMHHASEEFGKIIKFTLTGSVSRTACELSLVLVLSGTNEYSLQNTEICG